MDGIRRRLSRRDRVSGDAVVAAPAPKSRYDLDAATAVAAARDEARREEARRIHAWLRHPATLERVAGALYEERTGRMWRTAEEVDRISYIANARAIVGLLLDGLQR